MAKKTISSILHFNAARLRVTGVGNLNLYLRSLDDIYNQTLVPLVMISATNREPTVLANFEQQCAQLELSVTEIDESFLISKIVIFSKPVRAEYPG